jgi:hypothetical protein
MTKESATTQTRKVPYLILVLFALVVADGLISQHLISNGLGYEGNPILANWMLTTDLLTIKVAGAFISAFLLLGINKRRPRLALYASVTFIIIYTLILFWNILVLTIGIG